MNQMIEKIGNTRQHSSKKTSESSQVHPGTLDLRSNGLVLRSHGYTIGNEHKSKENAQKPLD